MCHSDSKLAVDTRTPRASLPCALASYIT